ncbi:MULTISPECIES: hypothetical protein [unclassified Microcoleus]|uniref:hypothetical protein n=1 Tax=unclassified Microcoleus TaxID=2642155 RepID=UPI001D573AF0|nr:MULTISPECIES: hypothetical protein [unclassified Microcoleus]MCC3472174.1 hypothetical protein [Microcoleus sp. PH2017_13_LAR_U_A]MCC3484793.1 hypothetical protein [Microcoleus sp. PH2017_14_LAR_D_A]MCC3595851.1 hypothetical protein [Microcoleus sp. PH2017_26_ELK_O_A]MCC3620654.1 hypothetical protein [Microcoleus sp. PH2017_36_ELK_O_B]
MSQVTTNSASRKKPSSIANWQTKFTTPQILRWGLYLVWGVSLLALGTANEAVKMQRDAIETIGKNTAPSVLTAQRIKDSLADLDANAANELLVKPGENPQAAKDYRGRQEKLSKLLALAAENITEGDTERQQIRTLILSLGDYMTQIERARLANERGDSRSLLEAYRKAANILDSILLPAAEQLQNVNLESLDRAYISQKARSANLLFLAVIGNLLPLVMLGLLQLFLYHRMRRNLNPYLLGATLCAIVLFFYITNALNAASYHLKVAKEDAFNSLLPLRQARALAYSANADESRYLLDREFAAQHERKFVEKMAKIAVIPANLLDFESVAKEFKPSNVQGVAGFTGLFAQEFANITFGGEREAAVEMLSAFGVYVNIDKQIRSLVNSDKRAEAIALCTGNKQGQSNWAFTQFLKKHNDVTDINLTAFTENLDRGFKSVGYVPDKSKQSSDDILQLSLLDRSFKNTYQVELWSLALISAIAILTFFGLNLRLKEYS